MKKILIIYILFFSLSLNAQPPGNFIVSMGGNGVDVGYGLKETYQRRYVIAGSTTSFGAGGADVYLAIIDSMGQIEWSKTYGGSMNDVGKSVIVSPVDSGFVIAGYTSSFGSGGYDFYVLRTDKIGNLLWQTAYGGLDWDFGADLIFSSDGHIIVCGSTYSSNYGKIDGQLIKLNYTTGSVVWTKTFGSIEDDEFVSLALTSDGYHTVCGNTKSYGDLNGDFWLFKINASGDSITSKQFGNVNKGEKCYDFLEDPLQRLVFCGSYDTSVANVGKNISYLLKTDLNGNYVSESKVSFPGMSDDKFQSIANRKPNNGYCMSRKVDHPDFEIDAQPYLMDGGFNFINTITFGGDKYEEAFDIIGTSDKGFAMLGYTKSYGLVAEDVYFIKVDSALSNAEELVGVEEKKAVSKNYIYYSNDVIYFNNTSKTVLKYNVYDITGTLLKTGETKEENIPIDSEFKSNIYFITIGENIRTKFIKIKE